MNKSASSKVLVFAVIVTLCSGMVTAGLTMSLPDITKHPIISDSIDRLISQFKEVTEDAIPIIYANSINDIGSSSGDKSTRSLLTRAILSRKLELRKCLSTQFDSQVDTILESARIQFSTEAMKGIKPYRLNAAKFSIAVKSIKLEVEAKLINLLMNSGDIFKTACDSLIETNWTDLLAELGPKIIDQIKESKTSISHETPIETRKLLEEHFAMYLCGKQPATQF